MTKPKPLKKHLVKKHKHGSVSVLDMLIKKLIISRDQLEIAKLEHKKSPDKTLQAILVEMGFITEAILGEMMSEASGAKHFSLKSTMIDVKLVRKVPKDFAIRNKLIAAASHDKKINIAIADIYDIMALDQLKRYFPEDYKILPVFSPESEIMEAIDQYYDYEMSIDGILKEIEEVGHGASAKVAEGEDYKNPTVRLVDAILIDAVHRGASDIHFEPDSFFLRLRYRIDGQMTQIHSLHKSYWPSIVVRLKVISSMNIAENRHPQDGRINMTILGRAIDFRVASLPTVFGENFVIRILDEKKSLTTLDQLGFNEAHLDTFKRVVKKPEGVIIITGPTGSGKTTTIYSLLAMVNSMDKNIMTLEDPVEYHLPLIRQTSIKAEFGLDFADGVRAIMRQDPDVIFIGEVRDQSTAIAAIRASITGHQVFTTLHTNDAISAVLRLLDLGIDPYLLSGALNCVISQRLARKICQNCRTEIAPTKMEAKILAISEQQMIYHGAGCTKCDGKGFKGRVAIAEIVVMDSEIDEMVATRATKNQMLANLKKKGFRTITDDGIDKVIHGFTTVDELMGIVDLTGRM